MGNRSRKAKKMGKNVVTLRTPAEYEALDQARVERERVSLAKQKENLERYAAKRAAVSP